MNVKSTTVNMFFKSLAEAKTRIYFCLLSGDILKMLVAEVTK